MSIIDVIEQGIFTECEVAVPISDEEQRVYLCTRSLRLFSGRRLTALSVYGGMEYIIKIFLSNRRAQREFRAELRSYELLQHYSYDIPSRIYHGPANDGVSIIIYEYLAQAHTLVDIFSHQPPVDGAGKKYFLQLMDLFVRFRKDRLVHRDPHLGNFLLRDDKIYIVDMGAIYKVHDKYLIKKSISLGRNYRITASININNQRIMDKNLALMLAQFDKVLHIESLYFKNYPQELNKDDSEAHAEVLVKLMERRQQRSESKFLRKIYKRLEWKILWLQVRSESKFLRKIYKIYHKKVSGECRGFHVFSDSHRRLIINRHYLHSGLINFISDAGNVFNNENTVLLKQESTTTVGIVGVDSRQYVVKRYNIPNFVHRLKLMGYENQVSRSWRNAHRLQFRGMRTAKPVALMECFRGRSRGISLYVTEYIAGSNADEFFRQEHLNEEIKNDVAMKIIGFIDELAMRRLVHGNLRLTSFVIDGNEPALINLDTMKVINNRHHLLCGIEKDRQRFRESWQGNAEARLILQPLMDAARAWHQ